MRGCTAAVTAAILSALAAAAGFAAWSFTPSPGRQHRSEKARIAGVTTIYRPNSHADVQLGRFIQGYNLDGTGDELRDLRLVSLYTDQVPENDMSRELARRHAIPIYETVEGALTLGTGRLAVDGVLLILEHGEYPMSPSGNKEYPKRRIFEEVVEVFRKTERVVPVFLDKHLSDNWEDASWIYETAREMGIPLMAGSSLPVAWRSPSSASQPRPDVEKGARLEEAVAVSIGSLDAGSFHALEFLQCLVERRAGGETGIRAVRGIRGEAVWKGHEEGLYDRELLFAALNRMSSRYYTADDWEEIRARSRDPVLWSIEYRDGLRASVFTLHGVAEKWTVAWRYDRPDRAIESVLADLQSARPYGHHGLLMLQVMDLVLSGRSPYPVERTLLVSGALDALLISLNLKDGARIETPYLEIEYQTEWEWTRPDPSPPDRTMEQDFPGQVR